MTLTDKQFTATARTIAIGILAACHQKEIPADETAAIAGAALFEVLGQILGPIAAVNHLRDIADLTERKLLDEIQ